MMNDTVATSPTPTASRWLAVAIPLLLLAGLVAALTVWDAARGLESGAPPPEEVVFDRVELREGQFVLHLRNAVSAPVSISQVMVDDAFWSFAADPSTDLGRYGKATVTIDYPWVEGEPHVVAVITNSGLVWEHEVAVSMVTPQPDTASLSQYAWIGILVGVIPIVVGMAFFPALRDAPERWTNAVLAFTLGLLAFLAIDTVGEGLELADEVAGALSGLGLFLGAAIAAAAGVLALDWTLRKKGAGAFALAILIAVGIGLHNLGEGLLIGSAFSIGSLALGSALILGFAVHNVTEGPAIVAPLVARRREGADASAGASSALTKGGRLGVARFALLAAIAGLPTVLGAWLGAFSTTGLLAVVFFGLGAGAIVVVLVQVGGALRREGALFAPLSVAAFVVGYAVMLATGLLTG